ncbi:hypothetical protein PTKU46_95070 [Paraburkholderia terrae]
MSRADNQALLTLILERLHTDTILISHPPLRPPGVNEEAGKPAPVFFHDSDIARPIPRRDRTRADGLRLDPGLDFQAVAGIDTHVISRISAR